jgi:hypothetical protein
VNEPAQNASKILNSPETFTDHVKFAYYRGAFRALKALRRISEKTLRENEEI